jgi:SAM-dependent methyltransferase
MASTEATTFYDRHPFDWTPPDASAEIRSVVSPSLADLIEKMDANSIVLDVGCGPGRVLGFLAQRGIRCIGLDRSRVSLDLAVKRYRRPGVVGDNLHLPFTDGCADLVISDGVIHHTEDPLAAFLENYRVLKPGGQMYLAVYKPSGRYPLLYRFPGALIRHGVRHSWTRPLVFLAQVPYFAVHFLRSRGKRTWAGARNLFFDYFVTPRVAFLARQAIEDWCARQGARIIRYDENRGANVHSFLLRKESCPELWRGAVIPTGVETLVAEKRESA